MHGEGFHSASQSPQPLAAGLVYSQTAKGYVLLC